MKSNTQTTVNKNHVIKKTLKILPPWLIIVTKNTELSPFIIISSSIITFKNSLLFIEFIVQYFICNTPEISIFF